MEMYSGVYSAFSNISVVGLGYVGLPTAAILASKKINVIGIDLNQTIIDTINRGDAHFIEPELDIIVHATVSAGYLRANKEPIAADAFIIAVPTPFKDKFEPDLSYVEAASRSIAAVLKKGDLIVLESTSPVTATEQMADWLRAERPDLTFPQTHAEDSDVRIAYCPERILPGRVLYELVHNDRIIGGMTPKCSARAVELYKIFVDGKCIVTDPRTAEMCKLAENSFRDINIAFANELSIICDKLNINVWELIRLANRHPRVNILKPGPGVGGHCIAVDPWFIVSKTPEASPLIRTAREVNDNKPLWVVKKIQSMIEKALHLNPGKTEKDITIACFGLTYKADIDDLRESPALKIVNEIASHHKGHVIVVEPNVSSVPLSIKNRVEFYSIERALAESDIVVKLVEHKQFVDTFDRISKKTIVLDICGEEA